MLLGGENLGSREKRQREVSGMVMVRKRSLLVCLLCAIVVPTCVAVVGTTPRSGDEASWQSSSSPHVRLGARDTSRVACRYTLVFTVVCPDGAKHRVTKVASGNDWAYVYFPGDFRAWWTPGKQYRWQCEVRGKVVVRGSFEHAYLRGGAEQITVE